MSTQAAVPDVAAWLAEGGPFGPGVKPRRIDTHAASVFLTEDRAWKLKRPVRFGYLDFSTPPKRKAALAEELRLNRRTAPGLYLGLHDITCAGGVLALDGAGEAIDHVLEMRRFPDGALLAELVSAGPLAETIWQRLADNILGLHTAADPVACADGAARLRGVVEGNAASMAAFPAHLDSDVVEALVQAQLAAIAAHARLLDRRGREGRVRHAHGDLHLRNIAMIDGKPTLFDCLEFDAELATTDVLYDLAFLLMDLWERSLRHDANLVFNHYLDRSADDEAGIAVLPLFMSVRASVRAHVMAAQASGARGSDAAGRARRYLALARELMEPGLPRLVAIGGLSGTGKSTLARALGSGIGRAPGARIQRSDVLRKRLARIAPETRLDAGAYTPESSAAVYAELNRLALQVLRDGQAVIADAVFGLVAERDAIEAVARDAGCPFTGIWLKLGEVGRVARIEGRGPDASDADARVARMQTDMLSDDAPGWHGVEAGGDIASLRQAVMPLLA